MGAIRMKIDFGSLAFGYEVEVGGGTPNWATSLGQGKDYKINDDFDIDEIIKGMVYSSIPLSKSSSKIGKGGKMANGGDENSPIMLSAFFECVFINDTLIDNGKFVLLVTRDNSKSHEGRLRLKYGPSNTYECDNQKYSNQDFINKMKTQLGLANDACWFVSEINIANQNELILKTVIVNPEHKVRYKDSKELHAAWKLLEPSLADKDSSICELKGENMLIYGVPGCGKSHYIKEQYTINDDNSERVVFHPDYTYSDFVGQILPKVKTVPTNTQSVHKTDYTVSGITPMMVAESPAEYNVNKTSIDYEFTPGPFTRMLQRCKAYQDRMHYLVIEEINRGNAPAIFGEIFQLLDRDDTGKSEYGINNADIADKVYGDSNRKVIIPNNLTVLSTMNTADQNVFTLDTAFKRRWEMLSIRNNFKIRENDADFNAQLECKLCGTELTWMKFATAINSSIVAQSESNLGSEDKRLGHFFVKPYEMQDVNKFSEKIIMYLWNDVFKFEKDNVFNSNYKTLEDVLDAFQEPSIRFKVFADKLGFSEFIATEDSQVEGDTDE